MVKPGVKTTELAVTVLTDIGIVAAALQGSLSPQWAAAAAAISSAAYAISRGITKNGAVTAALPAGSTIQLPGGQTATVKE